MNLFYYKCPEGNFGDDLNPWLWNKIIPEFGVRSPSTLFVGIGTILDQRIPKAERTIIFGTGVRNQMELPEVNSTWEVIGLRGPHSCRAMGYELDKVIGDPGYLVSLIWQRRTSGCSYVAYVPHISSVRDNALEWKQIVEKAGLTFVDPRDSVESVLNTIACADRVISESLHGAILADTFRIPWIPICAHSRLSEKGVNQFKWKDWSESIGMEHRSISLPRIWPLTCGATLSQRLKNMAKSEYAKNRLIQLLRSKQFRISSTLNYKRLMGRLKDSLDRLDLFLNS